MSTISSTTAAASSTSSIDLQQLLSLVGSSKGQHHRHRTAGAQPSQQTGTTGTTGSLNSQIQAAVVNAIQNYDASSGSPSGLMSAIQNAINTTLQNNGITPPGTTSQSTSLTPTLATATGSQLDALLQSNGISTTQFKQGLLQMLGGNNSTSNGNATGGFDLSAILTQIFKDVPAGTGVNVQA